MQQDRCQKVDANGVASVLTAAGVAVSALISGTARAEVEATSNPQPSLPSVEVTGTAITLGHDISQSVDAVSKKELAERTATR
jgi:hypothetical protein